MLARVASIAELMTTDVVTVAPEDTLGEAAAKMTEKGIGAVVVSDFGRIIGILSERDIMRAVADRIHSSEARVREWMTADPITATTETSVEEAGRTMLENGFRHLPVVDGERAIGMISIRDVAQYGLQD
jgi:CBS domain-containing protein